MNEKDNESYRVVIAGSRTFQDYNLLSAKCEEILGDRMGTYDITILSGGAKGADQLGERFAKEHNLDIEYHKADWKAFGKRAGLIRNSAMAENADALIAFWDGSSRGTKHMIDCAYQNGLVVNIVNY